MTASKVQQYLPIVGAIVLVLIAVYVYTSSGSTTGTQVIPGTNNDAAVAAAAQENAQLSANYNSGVFGAFNSLVGLGTTENNNATSIVNTSTQATAAETIAGQQSATQQALAQIQSQTSIAGYNAQLSAVQAQQQTAQHASNNQLIGGIFSGILGAFGL